MCGSGKKYKKCCLK
ncbi:hypothetical protein COM13_11765 [Bacillus pseudomycoides]|nr:hypothetical protein BLX05_23130 [Bacillus pseudomycoides]PDY02543.1 hypothetical protein COO07_00755 [Bacillus pseudomycoides]PDY11402.1 hypothetical protein COO16_15790 [Bacillus pseudomycoides]PEB40746.1 hypothetical protein COO06_16135 [Bacillus pseudomycoides]PEE06553.1 hypothetical protein CON86_09475 [Bacillus pseudomycoides]